jgi:hypothetical protein
MLRWRPILVWVEETPNKIAPILRQDQDRDSAKV